MEHILEQINSPKDLKHLSDTQLHNLSVEIRDFLLSTLSKTGGHLASNLGIVELTIALHYVFDAPKDKILWDVSHQTYPHKILTGRRTQFHTIRQYEGLSGFCKRHESLYDVYGAGHSSTSISAALGITEARDLRRDDFHVIAVIGDGSLTGGLAFEGLNNAGDRKKRNFIVVLNDNEMSISPNVGAISRYLSRLITGNLYNKLKAKTAHLMKAIPCFGEWVFRLSKRLDVTVKGFILSGTLFEQLGFKYVGPIDGHDIHQLIETLSNIRDYVNRPTLVHVVTKKGKGYVQAEKNATVYHGAKPFQISTGEFIMEQSPAPSYTKVFGESIVKLAEEDKRIVAITAAMTSGTGLKEFAERFPDRFFDVGIAEQHAVTFAAGLATEGFKPVVAIYSTFLQRAYDQVFHEVCLQNLPVTFALDRGGLVGADGPTHHGVFDYSYLRHLPNMVVMAPKDENELQHMLKTAMDYMGPISVRYPRGQGIGAALDKTVHTVDIGKAEIIKQGSDLAIIAIGGVVHDALKAAMNLENDENISAAVVNARFVKPLDSELIFSLARTTGKIVTVEENILQGGFGSAVLELLHTHDIQIPVRCIGLPDKFIEQGSESFLRDKYDLDAEGIEKVIRKFTVKNKQFGCLTHGRTNCTD
ncbi:MAG: 1-deoxy-D-xylulose-5-phosphate synthase [bacterium]